MFFDCPLIQNPPKLKCETATAPSLRRGGLSSNDKRDAAIFYMYIYKCIYIDIYPIPIHTYRLDDAMIKNHSSFSLESCFLTHSRRNFSSFSKNDPGVPIMQTLLDCLTKADNKKFVHEPRHACHLYICVYIYIYIYIYISIYIEERERESYVHILKGKMYFSFQELRKFEYKNEVST